MNTNKYFYESSKEILNTILEYKNNVENTELFNQYNTDISWIIISTTLLLSENLLKKENIYKLLNDKQFIMLENILDKTMIDSDYEKLESYFLDEQNHEINPFHNLTIDDIEINKYLEKERAKGYKKFGCNKSIITNNVIDYKKLIIRIRNSLAHTNYEIIDENYLRLYHYDENNKLDFNVKLNKVIALTVIDELNEIASKIYEPFITEYFFRNEDIQYTDFNLTDEEITKFLKQFNIIDINEINEVIEIAKKNPDYYPNYTQENNYNKFTIIYDIIFEKIKPTCDYGIILNEIIYYFVKNNKSLNYYFYEKYGYYDYFNSDLYSLSNKKNKQSLYINRFKILLFSYLNTVFLYNYNSNSKINYDKMDFSLLEIDEKIKRKYIEAKYKNIKDSFTSLLIDEKELYKISESLKKLEMQLKNGKNKNEFLTKVLPTRIETLKQQYFKIHQEYMIKKHKIQQEMYDKLFEISDLKANIDLKANLAQFITNHLRNSLAHGYIIFPNGINYNNLFETIICFEDYEKNNKEGLTFKATIEIGQLLEIISKEELTKEMFTAIYK